MARFRAEIGGNRGECSRLGSKQSGIVAKVNGWHKGIIVVGKVNADGEDVFTVWETGGSNGGDSKIIATIIDKSDTKNTNLILGEN